MNSFYFVFINYNNYRTTINCVKSIQQIDHHGVASHIIVIDNASQAADFTALSESISEFSNVRIIRSEKNLGYFGGLNLGISEINNPEKHFVVIGNNDLLYHQEFIQSALNKKEIFESYPVISPNIITLDGTHQNPHVINKISRFRQMIYDLYFSNYLFANLIIRMVKLSGKLTSRKDNGQSEIAQPIFLGHGSCYLLGPLFFDHFKELWAPTFLFDEELFLSKQLEQKGMKIFYEPSIKVTHCMHTSVDKIPAKAKWKLAREAHKISRELF
ncbi:MAG: glycosyltransferase family 2 protein [Bacteroidales bacterium]|nr:glycosyltransferase family 2 protein [Bacteroidales bacterium]